MDILGLVYLFAMAAVARAPSFLGVARGRGEFRAQ